MHCFFFFQEYDPDLPPELAAATGVHDVPGEHANSVKSDVGQSNIVKGSGRVRPPLVCICVNTVFHNYLFKRIFMLPAL